jgi:hypothetical protein
MGGLPPVAAGEWVVRRRQGLAGRVQLLQFGVSLRPPRKIRHEIYAYAVHLTGRGVYVLLHVVCARPVRIVRIKHGPGSRQAGSSVGTH